MSFSRTYIAETPNPPSLPPHIALHVVWLFEFNIDFSIPLALSPSLSSPSFSPTLFLKAGCIHTMAVDPLSMHIKGKNSWSQGLSLYLLYEMVPVKDDILKHLTHKNEFLAGAQWQWRAIHSPKMWGHKKQGRPIVLSKEARGGYKKIEREYVNVEQMWMKCISSCRETFYDYSRRIPKNASTNIPDRYHYNRDILL